MLSDIDRAAAIREEELSLDRLEQQQLQLHSPVRKPTWTFPSPFIPYCAGSAQDTCWGPNPKTLAELRMYGLSWAIRSKPEWQHKITNTEILDKWRKEALEQQQAVPLHERLTPNMINYVLTELSGYARLCDTERGIENGCFDAIWYSDRLISTQVSTDLRSAITELEDVDENLKDWHPGSNDQVLDLVHPSLYCITYGHTRCFYPLNSVFAALEPPEYDGQCARGALSGQFSWLPSDFSVDANDGSVKLLSPYINNLHPVKHITLYRLIESVVTSFVPLFERVLSQINGEECDLLRDRTPGSGRIQTKRVFGTWPWTDRTMFKLVGIAVPCVWENNREAVYSRSLQKKVPMVLPEAFETYSGELEKSISPYSLRGKTIQCIIKLANIHLSPDSPKYEGGSWHVEGMLNERIVASGIYYYEEDNISESRLSFRVTTSAPVYHAQDDEICSEILYGLKRNSHCCQGLGSMITKSGRALAWPNIYQHRVAPFELVDQTKPGHRKILAIFLVDPSIEPIPSATNVPPQQLDWVLDTLEETRLDSQSAFSRLPPELVHLIGEHLPDTYVTREQAEATRLLLMKERTNFVGVHDDELSHSFNMCEH
ncbi:hypothetical protein C8J57DRAFT_1291802 [Mycena rebaudengoi]|nr:hypothetical protein C8J57DRAFT_1291802 [Mycena rebaudengoi]